MRTKPALYAKWREDEPQLNQDYYHRLSYSGGNTNLAAPVTEIPRTYFEKGWRICMLDINSSYPSAMWDKSFPTAHFVEQDWRVENQPTHEWFAANHGIVWCEIYYPSTPTLFCPRRLLIKHPILHDGRREARELKSSTAGKFEFALWDKEFSVEDYEHFETYLGPADPLTYKRGCGKEDCAQCDRIRTFQRRGARIYTCAEVAAALDWGYEMVHVFRTSATPISRKDIFTPIVSQLFYTKLKSSKPPSASSMDTEEKRTAYRTLINTYGSRCTPPQGIAEDEDPIAWHEPNEGLRTTAKLALNSLTGKFGERGFKQETVLVSSHEEELGLLMGAGQGTYDIVSYRPGDVMPAAPQDEDDADDAPAEPPSRTLSEITTRSDAFGDLIGSTNVSYVALITARGRINLAECLNYYGHRALYHDTDSVCAVITPKEAPYPEIGPYLGQWDEEVRNGIAFFSIAPKTYALVYLSPDPKDSELKKEHWDMLKVELTSQTEEDMEKEIADMSDVEKDVFFALIRKRHLIWFEFLGGHIVRLSVKLRAKGLSLRADAARILTADRMRVMAMTLVNPIGESDPDDHATTIRQFQMDWQRRYHRIISRTGDKTITVNEGSLKGEMDRETGLLMPRGWRRWTVEGMPNKWDPEPYPWFEEKHAQWKARHT